MRYQYSPFTLGTPILYNKNIYLYTTFLFICTLLFSLFVNSFKKYYILLKLSFNFSLLSLKKKQCDYKISHCLYFYLNLSTYSFKSFAPFVTVSKLEVISSVDAACSSLIAPVPSIARAIEDTAWLISCKVF